MIDAVEARKGIRQLERRQAGLGLNQEGVGREGQILHAAASDAAVGEEAGDAGLVPAPVEHEDDAAGQGCELAGLSAKDGLRVRLVVAGLAFDDALGCAAPDHVIAGGVLVGRLHDQVAPQPHAAGDAAVVPGVEHLVLVWPEDRRRGLHAGILRGLADHESGTALVRAPHPGARAGS